MAASFFHPFRTYFPLLLPLLVLLPGLGLAPLFDVDEGAFSEATREMLARGDYLSTWLNGHPRFDKPILIYWLQAASVSLFGLSEWAFRLPSALAAALWCFVLSRFAEEFFDREAGWMASVVTLTCLGVQLIGRAATADSVLNLFLALTMVDLWRYLASGNMTAARRVFLWVGLGFLTKGPVAVLIPGASVFLWCLFSKQWAPLWRAVKDVPGWMILLGISLPWYVVAYQIHGEAFIQGFFMKHNVQRFSSTLEGHGGSLLYFLVLVPLFLVPWWPWMWGAVRRVGQNWSSPLHRFLWLWCLFVFVFFSLSGTKLPHYALYGCTPLFVLIAAEYAQSSRRYLSLLPALLVLLFLASIPLWLGRVSVEPGFYTDQMARLDAEMIRSAAIPAGLLVGVGLSTVVFWRLVVWRQVAILAVLASMVLSLSIAPMLGDLLQGPVKRTALLAKDMQQPVVQWQGHWPSFSVYLQAETPLRAPESGELAVIRLDRIPATVDYTLLHREGGVALIQTRGER